MKMMKWFSFFILLTLILLPTQTIKANQTTINVHDFGIYGDGTTDQTAAIQQAIDTASLQQQSLYFPAGSYIISDTLYLKPYVSLYGDESTLTVMKGKNNGYAVMIKDSTGENLADITIEQFIFDNVVIHSNGTNHANMRITKNVFINGKKADLNQYPVVPDANNKNGGELTGYYILRNNQNIEISHNIFLRDANSKGRGIGTYRTTDSMITDNYFGYLENFDDISSQISSIVKENLMKLQQAKENGVVYLSEDQGHFMTAINVINHDVNMTIHSNTIRLNTDIEEMHYEDGSGSTLGYNRDHLIYAKGFTGLNITGNYFEGQPNNADGGIKIRNGRNVNVVSNYFNNVPLLMYIQADSSTSAILSNVWIENNMFYIKNNQGLWGSGISARFYEADELENMTIQNNRFLSDGSMRDKIKLDLDNQVPRIENLHLEQNRYIPDQSPILNEVVHSTIGESFSQRDDIISPNPYLPQDYEDLLLTPIPLLMDLEDVSYGFQNGRLITNADLVWLDGKPYDQSIVTQGQHILYLRQKTTVSQIVEGQVVDIPVVVSTYVKIDVGIQSRNHIGWVNQNMTINFNIIGGEVEDVMMTSSINELVEINENQIRPLAEGTTTITLKTQYGYQTSFELQIYKPVQYDWQISSSIVMVKGDSLDLQFSISPEVEPNDIQLISLDEDLFTIDEAYQIHALQPGAGRLQLTIEKHQFSKIVTIRIKPEALTLIEPTLSPYYFVGDVIDFLPESTDSTLSKEDWQVVVSENLQPLGNNQYKVIKTGTIEIKVTDPNFTEDQLIWKGDAYLKPSSLSLSESQLVLTVGDEVPLDVLFQPFGSWDEVIIYNTDEEVISYDGNIINAKNTGMALLTFKTKHTSSTTTLLIEVIEETKTEKETEQTNLYVIFSIIVVGLSSGVIYLIKRKK